MVTEVRIVVIFVMGANRGFGGVINVLFLRLGTG